MRPPRRHLRWSWPLIVAAVVALPVAAFAQPTGPDGPDKLPGPASQPASQPDKQPDKLPDKPTENPDDQLARKLYRDGDRRYAEGRYEEAIAAFTRAYGLSKRALIQFAMANTYERMDKYALAREALLKYVRASPAGDEDAVRQRINQLEKRIAADKVSAAELVKLRARSLACQACDTDKPQPRSKLPVAFWGAGGIAAVSAVVFAALASSANGDAVAGCTTLDGSNLCTADARDALDRERRFSAFADLSIGVALISSGIGTYLWWRGKKPKRTGESRVLLTPTRNGLAVVGGF